LRRLYSMFAGSWPGAGLLLLRVVVGSVVLVRGSAKLWTAAPLHMTLTSATGAASALLLIAGLWTPVAGTIVALLEASHVLATVSDRLVCLLAGTVGAALAMLGPGRWSVDARLFGWKRIEAPPRRSPSDVR
jgi:putative oxidoreductase